MNTVAAMQRLTLLRMDGETDLLTIVGAVRHADSPNFVFLCKLNFSLDC